MRESNSSFVLAYVLLVIVQMLLCNYFHVSSFIFLTVLPVMILCLPTKTSTTAALFIAFVTGLAVDIYSEGVFGLNTFALVPIAFLRKPIIQLVFGEEIFARNEDFTVNKNGFGKVSVGILLVLGLFLMLYIWADGAGTRPFWFSLTKWTCSMLFGYLLSLVVVHILCPSDR